MMEKNAKIYVAGHRGMVGSAIVRELERQGYTNIITRTHAELDLTRQADVEKFFEEDTIAHVTYSSKKGVSDLDIRIEEKGVTYMAEEENRDLYAGIDLAIDKILGQIRKQKTKILSSRN